MKNNGEGNLKESKGDHETQKKLNSDISKF